MWSTGSRPLTLLLALATTAFAGRSFLLQQSACRVRCLNGGACAYDTEDSAIHSCLCIDGLWEGDRCERLVPGAVLPTTAATTTTTTTISAAEIERQRYEAHRLRVLAERQRVEESRRQHELRLEQERQRQEEARLEDARRAEQERLRYAEEERARAEEERLRLDQQLRAREEQERRYQEEEQRKKDEEARNGVGEEAQRREKEEAEKQKDTDQVKLDYEGYDSLEDSELGGRLEEVPEPNAVDQHENIDTKESEHDHVMEEELEKAEGDEEEMEILESQMETTPSSGITYEVEHSPDYVTSTIPVTTTQAEESAEEEDKDDDYWDHTPINPDVDQDGLKRNEEEDEGKEERTREERERTREERERTREERERQHKMQENEARLNQAANDQNPMNDVEDGSMEDISRAVDTEEGDDGWMMVTKKRLASSSSLISFPLTILSLHIAFLFT